MTIKLYFRFFHFIDYYRNEYAGNFKVAVPKIEENNVTDGFHPVVVGKFEEKEWSLEC